MQEICRELSEQLPHLHAPYRASARLGNKVNPECRCARTRIRSMMRLISVCWAVLAAAADADHIVARAAENMEKAAGARTQFVYQQAIRSSLVRSDGTVSRREKREYSVIPNEKSTGKKLVSFSGEYRDGKQMVAYTKPGHKRTQAQGYGHRRRTDRRPH